jgi:hypothetical protein
VLDKAFQTPVHVRANHGRLVFNPIRFFLTNILGPSLKVRLILSTV